MEYKCPNCGGELHFDPHIHKLKCDFCGNTYDLNEFEDHSHASHADTSSASSVSSASSASAASSEPLEYWPDEPSAAQSGFTKATDDSTDRQEDLVVYSCPHCGAEIVTDKNTVATTCIFCHTPMVIEEKSAGKFRPDKVIPFEIDKKQVADLYENYIKDKPFYPPEYSKASVIEKIQAIYLPFWLYDLHMQGHLQATGEHTHTFTMGDWIITNHDVFAIDRAGDQAYFKIPVIASSRTPKDAMDSIEPFDYSKLTDYNPGYLPGFLAERYDLDHERVQEFSRKRAENSFNQAMTNTIGAYEGLRLTGGEMHPQSIRAQYALMPAYMLFMDYDAHEDKLIAINGQTGKVVGNVPVDKHKRNRYFIRWFLILGVLFLAIALMILLMID